MIVQASCICERSDSPAGEVTPEMRRAGAVELSGFEPGEESGENLCERIYLEMERARLLARSRRAA